MLFNSYVFLFAFLPAVLAGFYLLRRFGKLDLSISFLIFASFIFYSYWEPSYFVLLFGSIVGNYLISGPIASRPRPAAKLLLILGVAANLALLGYFKYSNFIAANVAELVGIEYTMRAIVLPIGISFFTFQQIAYLVDCHTTRAREAAFGDYALFVSFFPQLIAGPIIHHSLTRPQFARLREESVDPILPAFGVIIFVIGLSKKVLLADNLARGADPIFNAVDAGAVIDPLTAWTGTLAYTLQIYFDFSGYSDMAIGLALLFGIRMAINFDSPYKSRSIIEFWRRWHITLSTWLRDYLYIPLGGNRGGELSRLKNVFITMLLGGIWHGAGWTFVIWGALHGTFIVINHAARKHVPALNVDRGLADRIAKQAATMLIVMIAWVFFRATTVSGAMSMLGSMAAIAHEPTQTGLIAQGLFFWILVGASIALFLPNTQEITRYSPDVNQPLELPRIPIVASIRQGRLIAAPSPAVAIACGTLFAVVIASIWKPAIFIYFNF